MRVRTATVGMGGQRLLAFLTALAVITSLVLVVSSPAWAHTPTIGQDCHGWNVDLRFYNTNGDNSVKIWIDGNLIVDEDDFGASHYEEGAWDPTQDHTIKVEVEAWDDPTGSEKWSFTYETSVEACEQATTSSTVPPTTTTTLPPTTTTTLPPTTTTTLPPTTSTLPLPDKYVCANGEVITVGPDDERHDGAYATKDEAANDPACQPTTTTEAPTTTLPDRWVCDEGEVVEVGPDDERYDGAYDTAVEAADDEDCLEVQGTVVTTTPEVEEEELPFTGVESNLLFALSVVLLGAGLVVLTITRKLEDN